jgi:hypothetical protein
MAESYTSFVLRESYGSTAGGPAAGQDASVAIAVNGSLTLDELDLLIPGCFRRAAWPG